MANEVDNLILVTGGTLVAGLAFSAVITGKDVSKQLVGVLIATTCLAFLDTFGLRGIARPLALLLLITFAITDLVPLLQAVGDNL